jgi:nucleotide-binding universal stress UspA family protein
MRILLATDGSSHSEEAALTLRALSPPTGSEILVVHVIEPPYYFTTPMVAPTYRQEMLRVQEELRKEADEAASRAIEEATRLLAGMEASIESRATEGHPADEIVRTAAEFGADLAVVGSKGLTGSKLFLLGSVSQKVAKYAPCSVLMTKPTKEARPPSVGKIILATDGSEQSMVAAELVSSFNLPADSTIVILHVTHEMPRRLPQSGRAQLALEGLRQARLDHAEKVINDTKSHLVTSAEITTSIREGNAAEEIIRVASETEADLIVMGSIGASGVKRFLLGSVSQKVYRYSEASVMLARRRPHTVSNEEG